AAGEVDSDDLPAVARAAAEGAAKALVRTPEQLSVLARAGVVDAGGRGLVVLLEALVDVVDEAVTAAPLAARSSAPAAAGTDALARRVRAVSGPPVRESGSARFGYEVQYLLDAPPAAVERLRDELAPLGDSLVVVSDGGGTWNVHVHVNDVGGAIEAG